MGARGPWCPRSCPSVLRASLPGAWSPAGIDVKRWRRAAYRRLTWTLLHTPFLPRPLPVPRTRTLARYKRRERGRLAAPASAPWRAPASGCCRSWGPPCCCSLCWAPAPRRTLRRSPEPWTSTPPWRTRPTRRSWSVSPAPGRPPGRPRGPLLCTSSLPPSPPPFPGSGRGEMSEKSGLPLSSKDCLEPTGSQQSVERLACPRSSERPGTGCQYLGQRPLSFRPSSTQSVGGVPGRSARGSGAPYN